MIPFVPPIKCQGIKTKLVQDISKLVMRPITGRWIEPFCGSCVVALNILPQSAILADTNRHIIQLYSDIQSGKITPESVTEYLYREGELLRQLGEKHYYEVRSRFNQNYSSLDFLFLNRSCFNGVMRFNRKGKFNVPFCHKPNRFAQAYITKIRNQVRGLANAMHEKDWQFLVANFRDVINMAQTGDIIYADPPYAGRHVDYYNSWSEQDEHDLAAMLHHVPCQFILSTWLENSFRKNPGIPIYWDSRNYTIISVEHFYHVGSSESLRHAMSEGVITNMATVFKATGPFAEQASLSI